MADASPDTVLCLKHIYKYQVYNTPLHVSTLIAGTEHRNLWDTQYSRWAQAAAAPKPCSVLSRQLKCRVLGASVGGAAQIFTQFPAWGTRALSLQLGLWLVGKAVVLGLLFVMLGVAALIIPVVVELAPCHQGGASPTNQPRCATIPQLKSIRALHDAGAGWSLRATIQTLDFLDHLQLKLAGIRIR